MKEYHLTLNEHRYSFHLFRNGKYIIKDYSTYFYKNNLFHREDGPAKEYFDGQKSWLVNGVYHRLDGPAIEYSNGDVEYRINGQLYSSKEEYEIAAYIINNKLESYQ